MKTRGQGKEFSVMQAVFTACVALVLCMPMTLAIAGTFVKLPYCLGVNDRYSLVEARAFQQMPIPDINSFASREFQDSIETFAADHIPHHDCVMLANATLQRVPIRFAAMLLGYDSYHTYYGSARIYNESADLVLKLPTDRDGEDARGFGNVIRGINGIARAHPDVSMAVCAVGMREYETNAFLPDIGYDPIDPELTKECFLDQLDSRIDAFSCSPQESGIDRGYYRTDHHWEMRYAFASYVTCLAHLDSTLQPVQPTGFHTWDNIDFYGSRARMGLITPKQGDRITDVLYEASELDVSIGDKRGDVSLLVHATDYADGDFNTRPYANHYVDYYHGDYDMIKIVNANAPSDKTLLFISSSLGVPIDRLFAESFHTVYFVNYRVTAKSLSELLEAYDIDQVLFLAADDSYRKEDMEHFLG